jgi:hypothetical protein
VTCRGAGTGDRSDRPKPPEPVDVVDGIPDRSPRPAWWKYAVLAAVLLAWVGFLIACEILGSP